MYIYIYIYIHGIYSYIYYVGLTRNKLITCAEARNHTANTAAFGARSVRRVPSPCIFIYKYISISISVSISIYIYLYIYLSIYMRKHTRI